MKILTEEDFINATVDQKPHDAQTAFSDLITQKLGSALEDYKKEIAQSMFGDTEAEEEDVSEVEITPEEQEFFDSLSDEELEELANMTDEEIEDAESNEESDNTDSIKEAKIADLHKHLKKLGWKPRPVTGPGSNKKWVSNTGEKINVHVDDNAYGDGNMDGVRLYNKKLEAYWNLGRRSKLKDIHEGKSILGTQFKKSIQNIIGTRKKNVSQKMKDHAANLDVKSNQKSFFGDPGSTKTKLRAIQWRSKAAKLLNT